jgi:hypothetical protein
VETPTHINGATLDVHYPIPAGSDTLCRKLVDSPAGETDASGRIRAAPELALEPTLHAPPRRGSRSIEPKVSSILEEHL